MEAAFNIASTIPTVFDVPCALGSGIAVYMARLPRCGGYIRTFKDKNAVCDGVVAAILAGFATRGSENAIKSMFTEGPQLTDGLNYVLSVLCSTTLVANFM